MKRILDPAFRYRPSFATDVRETFARARREREGKEAQGQIADAQEVPSAATIAATQAAGGAETSIEIAPRGASRVAN